MITGHCECGAVSFEIDGEITDFSHCHCSQCRRLHGAAYATFATVATDKFRYLSGEETLGSYASSEKNQRAFCSRCGSNILVSTADYPAELYVAMGVIDGDPAHPDAYHIYASSKAPWHEITDGAPQYDREPPE